MLQVYTGREKQHQRSNWEYETNFFKLLEDLEKDGIYACGTARADRRGGAKADRKVIVISIIKNYIIIYLFRGDSPERQGDGNRVVRVISTAFETSPMYNVQSRQAKKSPSRGVSTERISSEGTLQNPISFIIMYIYFFLKDICITNLHYEQLHIQYSPH